MACDHEGRPSVTALIHQVHLSAGGNIGASQYVATSRDSARPCD